MTQKADRLATGSAHPFPETAVARPLLEMEGDHLLVACPRVVQASVDLPLVVVLVPFGVAQPSVTEVPASDPVVPFAQDRVVPSGPVGDALPPF